MKQDLRQEVEQLRERSRGEASLVHARAVADDSKAHESLQKGVAAMKLKDQSQASKVTPSHQFTPTILLLILFLRMCPLCSASCLR